jgi:hypothetical protein
MEMTHLNILSNAPQPRNPAVWMPGRPRYESQTRKTSDLAQMFLAQRRDESPDF